MIGTGRQFLEAAVSQPDADESDPLLDFSSEGAAENQTHQANGAPEGSLQTTVGLAVPAPQSPPAPPSIPIETLIARIEGLETALDDSKIQVSTLKSEVAILVRVIGDIKNSVGDVKNSVSEVQNSVGGVTNSVSDVKNTVSEVKNSVSEVKKSLSDVKNTVSDIKKKARSEVIRTAVSLPGPVGVSRMASAILTALVGLGSGVFGWMYFTGAPDSRSGAVPEPTQETAFVPADQPVAPAPPQTSSPSAPVPVPGSSASRASTPNTRVRYVGTLSVDSQPGGEVFLNTKSAGHTPLRLTNLRAGSHLIWVEHDGYQRWTRVVQVPADRVTRLFADLEPLSAR